MHTHTHHLQWKEECEGCPADGLETIKMKFIKWIYTFNLLARLFIKIW